jgi:two-component system sensor histidine kinase PilS (NtrC family)
VSRAIAAANAGWTAQRQRLYAPADQLDFARRVRVMMGARVLVGAVLLIGSALPLEIGTLPAEFSFRTSLFFRFTILIFSVSLIYLLLFNRIRNLLFFAYVQVLVDIFLETMVIYSTGGAVSPFSILYLFTIIYSSLVLTGRPHFIFATISCVMYLWLILAEYFRIIEPNPIFSLQLRNFPRGHVVYIITVNIAGFFAVAALSHAIVGRLQRTDDMLQHEVDRFDDFRSIHQNVVHSLKTGLMTLSNTGQVTLLNSVGEKILGIPFKKALQASHDEIFPPALSEAIQALISQPDNEMVANREFYHIRDGKRVVVSARASLLVNHRGERRGVIVEFSDVSRIKEMEGHKRLADRWAGVAELAANLAHEIRNPMAAISGSVEILRGSLGSGTTSAKLADIITRETRRLNELITQFLDFAKPTSMELRPCEVNGLLEEILAMLENAPQRPAGVKLQLEARQPESWVLADVNKLRQVFWNILLNALQAMPDGGECSVVVDRSVGAEIPSENGNKARSLEMPGEGEAAPHVWVKISDTGCGIDPDHLELIFTPFTSFREKGTGLGLSISYKIVQELGGRIRVRSEPGQGSDFHIFLPAVDPALD